MIKTKLYECLIIPEAMKITTPKSGFTRYLAQSKDGEAYMKGDMNTNFVFYEPFNEQVFKLFDNEKSERLKLYEDWNNSINNNDKYICQNIEFINDELQEEIDTIFENPNEELAKALQDIVEVILVENPQYDICIGVAHGKQLTESGARYPHIHLLLRKKVKNGYKK